MTHGSLLLSLFPVPPGSLVALALAGACAGPGVREVRFQERVVSYHVSMASAQTQTVEITMDFPTGGEDATDVLLPVWRPGKYAILDPVGTLRQIRATDADGAELPLRKTAKSSWRIDTSGVDRVRVEYSIYANSIGDRTRHVDATHAFLSGSAVFLYTPRLRTAPLHVEFDAPVDWDVATGLEAVAGRDDVFFAPNYDVLVDSPFEAGKHDRYVFEFGGRPHEIVIWPAGIQVDAARMKADFAAIVEAQTAVFGDTPYGRYVFLIHAGGGGGGGTEHLNSTIMQTSRESLEASLDNGSSYQRFLGLVAHEMFHTWNVKQLRPAGIHPYDYQAENYTDLLWMAEGGTSYYGDLSLVRAGLEQPDAYLNGLASTIQRLRQSPGRRVQSLSASSFDAWTQFNRSSPDDANAEVSFYSGGLVACLLLDMQVRTQTEGRVSLDDVLKELYRRFPLSGPGYTTGDLVAVLDELTGAHFADFVARYIEDTEPLPLEEALRVAGVELAFEPAKRDDDDAPESDAIPYKPYLGLRLRDAGSGAAVSTVLADGPAYGAGILVGDEILTLNGRRLRSGDLDDRLERLEPGDPITLHLLRRDELHEIQVTLAGIPDGKWTCKLVEGPTPLQQATYASWLGQPWPQASGQ